MACDRQPFMPTNGSMPNVATPGMQFVLFAQMPMNGIMPNGSQQPAPSKGATPTSGSQAAYECEP